MAPPPPPTSITLTVKVPPGYIDGGADHFALGSVDVSSTIGAIRQHIQQTVPSHPAPEKQRILYGGRALVDNEQTLADALNTKRDPTQTEYVIHLLVKGEGQGSSTPTATGAGSAHRRIASTPAVGAQQPISQQVEQGQAAHVAAHDQVRLQQEHLHRLLVQQQQQLVQQRAQMGGMGQPQFAMPQMPMPPGFPFQQQPIMGHGFGQAVAQGQQQRAAMGMHGVGAPGQPTNPPQNGVAQSESAQAPGITAGQQPTHWDRTTSPPAVNGPPGQQPQPAGQQQPQQGAPRPISGQGFHFEGIGPNGQRVQIHQQTLQIPGMPGQPPFAMHGGQPFSMPGQPFGMPGMMPHLPGFPGQPQMFAQPPPPPQSQQPAGPSALSRARENVVEMRRMLDELRDSNGATEDQRSRIERLRERVQSVDDYIDPFHLGGANNATTGRRSAPPQAVTPEAGQGQPQAYQHWGRTPGANAFANPPMIPVPPLFNGSRAYGAPTMQQPRQSGTDTTCYLLSGPQGPQALLFSPQHGTYTGAFAHAGGATRPIPTPTTTQQGAQMSAQLNAQQAGAQQALAHLVQPGQQPANAAAAPVAAPANAQAQAQPAAADPNGPAQALLNHVWLLFRVLIFAYFLLGSNLGWKRPLALMAIGIGFWMVRNGLFGEGGIMRRWWEGIVRVGPAPAPAEGAQGQQRPAGMPTPEQVAQRLIDERNAGRQQAWREFVRPVERAVALFVASLWPGIGEAHVRARREEEERRRNEEEVAARQREEEAKKREEEAGKKDGDGEKTGDSAGEKASASAPSGAVQEGTGNAMTDGEKASSQGTDGAQASNT